MTEPLTLVSGDTLAWRRDDLSAYPSSDGWALAYKLIGAGQSYTLGAVGDAAGYAVSASAAVTALWVPGRYAWAATVTHGDGRRYTIGQGSLTVTPNLAALTGGMDLRGPARQALEAMDAALRDYGAKAYLREIEMGGRRQRFGSPEEFMAFRSRLQREANAEDVAAGLRPRTSNRLLTRFAR